jgi:gliding motility-associated-like protein
MRFAYETQVVPSVPDAARPFRSFRKPGAPVFGMRLLIAALLLLCSGLVQAQTPYTYTLEGFDDVGIFPTTAPAVETAVTSSTGTWRLFKGNAVTGTDPCGSTRALRLPNAAAAYLITPKLNNGAGVMTFNDNRSNRTFNIYTSTDDGATFTLFGTVGNPAANCATLTVTINNPLVNRIKIANLLAQDAGIDNLLITAVSQTAPTVTTTAATGITFTSATSGGNVTSDGLAAGGVTARGLAWGTSPGPLAPGTAGGSGVGAFTTNLSGLTPGTTYYYRAYATNSIGTSYGAELSFTTPTATPTLTATPILLDFGNQAVGTISGVLSYSLSGIYLTPAAGSITISAPAGYTVSTNANGPFGATATLAYTGSALAATTIYVRFSPTTIGVSNANVTNTGGGAGALNVAVSGIGTTVLPGITNVGFDFWTGFGYQEKMNQKAGTSGEAKLSIYISVPAGTSPATVKVELPGVPGAAGFPQTVTVTPGTVTEVTNFPTGDAANALNPSALPDTRLYYTGVSNRGIHVYSTNGIPISVWMHSYTSGNSAAGAMLFPTNTWASSYTVQAYGGYSNNSNPNSFFFVVAKEDNTPIWFTPSQNILDSVTGALFTDGHTAAMVKYPAGVQVGPIMLQKGQVFNAMGFIQGSGSGVGSGKAFGLDLSGSTIRTNCDKSIAVFGGNGRVLVNATGCSATSGSDHMIQQMFPSVAWGKRYLTAPTTTMEYNVYRVNVSDPTTQVWVNSPAHAAGTALSPATLVNNLYYEFASSLPQLIESDKPITVTQFIVAQGCANANGSVGLGDPEMIILSPVEQAINNTTVYSAPIKNPAATYNGHYINVIIRTGGVASFRLDGGTTGDPGIDQTTATATTVYNTGGTLPLTSIFKPHPQLAGFSYAQLRVTPSTSHTLASDSAFNAIAYGMGDGESYGYNAGASIKDLSQYLLVSNPYGVTNGLTCKGNNFYFRIAVPYAPADLTSLSWNFYSNPAMTPNANVTQNAPTPDSTFSVDGVNYYVYRIATPYQFSQAGTYSFQVLANALTTGSCTGVKVLNNSITVKDGPRARFNPVIGTCGSLSVQFSDVSTSDSTAISRWNWNFGDGATLADTSHVQNPTYLYPTAGTYSVSLRAVNEAGCFADTTRSIDLSGAMSAVLTRTPTTSICAGSSITFTNNSTASGTYGTPATGTGDFGDGQTFTLAPGASVTHTYSLPGTFQVTFSAQTSNSCSQAITPITFTVNPIPAVSSAATGTVCTGNAQNYTIASTVATGASFSWSRPAVAGISNAAVSNQTANPITEALVNSTNAPIVVSYTITTTSGGCTSAPFTYSVTVYPTVTVTSAATGTICSGAAQAYGITTNVPGATISWSRAAVTGISNTAVSNQTAATITEALTNTTNAPVNVTYVITPSVSGCTSTSFNYTVTVYPRATVSSAATGTVCSGAPMTYNITGSASGTTYSWSRPAVTGISNAAVSNSAANPISETLTNTTNAAVAVTYTITPSANGCAGTPFTYTVTVNPTATVSSAATAQVCSATPFAYTSTSPVAGATFAWTRAAVTGISNAAGSGNGNIAETLTNTTAAAVVVNYVITPTANGCPGTPMTLAVTVNPTPTANFSFANNSCTTSPVNFTAITTGTISGYSWNFGDTSPAGTGATATHSYSNGGSFNVTLTVTSASGCTATSAPQAVTVAAILAAPVVTFDAPGANAITFRWNAVPGAASYEVSVNGGAFVPANGTLSHTVSGLQPNTAVAITVRALGALTCQSSTGTATATTMMPDTGVFVPNTFSPNGDGHNDVLKVYSNFIAAIDMRIFNQWGQQIFSSTDPARGWDGTSKGRMQPVGVYVYVIKVTMQNGTVTTEKGIVNLIR